MDSGGNQLSDLLSAIRALSQLRAPDRLPGGPVDGPGVRTQVPGNARRFLTASQALAENRGHCVRRRCRDTTDGMSVYGVKGRPY